MTCQECMYFFEDYGHGHQCRRYPKWELHTPEDWCGEFVAVNLVGNRVEMQIPAPEMLPIVPEPIEVPEPREWKKKKRY